MPKTAFSTFFQGEFDVDQLLIRVGYPVSQDPDLTGLPHDLRQWIANDVVCSSCGVGGAIVVGRSRARGTGKAVSQAHFRFLSDGAAGAHDPLCDFYDELVIPKTDHLVDFRGAQSELTRAVGELVCRGIELRLFSQTTMREMRQWFLDTKKAHVFRMDVSEEMVRWCAALWEHAWQDGLPFQPAFGDLPGFDWKRAAGKRFGEINAGLIERCRKHWWGFREKDGLARTLQLIRKSETQTVFDVRVLADKYQMTIDLANFAAKYSGVVKAPVIYRNQAPPKGAVALLALSALLLFVGNWQLDRAVEMFVRLRTAEPARDETAGNLIGLNPFHDFVAWESVMLAREVAADSHNGLSASDQLTMIEADLRDQYRRWKASARP